MILGGAALQRCGKCKFSDRALAPEETAAANTNGADPKARAAVSTL